MMNTNQMVTGNRWEPLLSIIGLTRARMKGNTEATVTIGYRLPGVFA